MSPQSNTSPDAVSLPAVRNRRLPGKPCGDYILPWVGSFTLHALLFCIVTLSVFRSPAVIVARDPASLWLIPFVNAGDFLSERELPGSDGGPEAGRVERLEPVSDVRLPAAVTPPSGERRDTATRDGDETADAELVVMAKGEKPEKPEKSKLPQTKPVAVAARPAPPEIPAKIPATVEQTADPVGTQQPPISGEPVTSAEMQAVAAAPDPPMKMVTAAVPAPLQAVTSPVARQPAEIPKDPVTISPAMTTTKAPATTTPPATGKYRVAATDPAPVRSEQGPPSSLKSANGKNVHKEPLSAAVRPVMPAAPAVATIVAGPATAAPAPAKRESPRGIVAPRITGDIRLSASGAVIPLVTITFQEFATSRRNKALSRAEARRVASVTPVVTSRDGEHHFVIVQSRAGVYTITTTARETVSLPELLLKLFEGGSRESTRKIGGAVIADRVVVVKLLMPDGIFWDDDAAFSGTLEDSDSITKFIADSGLTWKEYK
jgi:hypothetical protein